MLEEPREHVAARAREAVHEHRHRAAVAVGRPCAVARVAASPVVRHGAVQELDEARRDLPAAVPALVDQERGLHALAVELTDEFRLPVDARVRHIDVADPAARELLDATALRLDPVAVVERVLACHRPDDDIARVCVADGLLRHRQHHGAVRHAKERRPRIARRVDVDAIHGKEIVALCNAKPLRRQRAARRVVERGACLEAGELPRLRGRTVVVEGGRELDAQHADGAARRRLDIALALQVRVACVELGDHLRDQVVEVLARDDGGEHRLVLDADRGPVDAVHPRLVEVVAEDAPRVDEDLPALGARVDRHEHRRGHDRLRGRACA